MWDKLSMTEKARIIALGVQSGITDLSSIRNRFDYNQWKERIKQHKGIDIDNDPSYDYEEFYRSNPNRAWDMMNKDSEAHFIDEFKTSQHPSFSNQSIYSGYKNKYNPNGITGGTWIDNYNYQLSQSQFDNDWDTDRTLDYFEKAESHPVNLYAPDGSTILRGVTVTPQSSVPDRDYSNKYDIGGNLRKRIKSALGKSTNRQATRINTRQFQSSNVEQVDRVNYYNPITGQNYGDTMPEGMAIVRRFEDLTPQAQDEYMANRSTQLDDLVVYPRSGKGAKSTNMGSYYDTMNTLTEQNRKHAEEVAMQDALVRETSAFEKPLNFLSPGQYFGAAVDYFQGESPFWEGVYNGNSGWVTDSFAEKYPGVATLANAALDMAFDYAPTASIKAINKSPNLVAKLRHPTYKKYYHGTSADFNIKDARMGSTTNLGLHASGTPKIAEDMKMHNVGTNPHVKEFYAPKPSTESIDTWNNGIEQLSTDYEIKHLNQDFGPSGYDAAGNNKRLFGLIKDAGGEPYMVEGTSSPKYNVKNDVTLNLREKVYPKVKDPKVDQLIKEFRSILQNNNVLSRSFLPIEQQARIAKINAEAAKILSDNGYKVVKYNNVAPLEGGGGSSYIITDPSVIYQHTPFTEYGLPPLTLIRKQQDSASSKK